MLTLKAKPAKLLSVNCRSENNGQDLVAAADLKFSFDSANEILDDLDPNLRAALFAEGDSPQGQLVEAARLTRLRIPGLHSMPFDGKLIGYGCLVSTPFDSLHAEFTRCDVDNFKLEPKDGGTVTISLRVRVKPQPEALGQLGVRVQHDLLLTLTPPTSEELEQIAAEGKEPTQGDAFDPVADADREMEHTERELGGLADAESTMRDDRVAKIVDGLLTLGRYDKIAARLPETVADWDDLDREEVLDWLTKTVEWNEGKQVNIPTKPVRMADIDELAEAANLPAAPAKGSRRRNVN